MMEAALSIGGLILLPILAVWFLISEARSHATQKAAADAATGVIDGLKRFEKARRDSAGLPRRERIEFMLREVRAADRGAAVSEDEGRDAGASEGG